MSRSKKRKSNANNRLGAQTRSQLKQAAKDLEITKMSQDENKTSLSQVLSLIAPFDAKKIANVKFYLVEFDALLERAKVENDFRLQILKVKFVVSAREKLVLDEGLNSEKDYLKFKEKILDRFQKMETFTEKQAQFNATKQKPNQSMKEFIEEFNISASKYFNMTS